MCSKSCLSNDSFRKFEVDDGEEKRRMGMYTYEREIWLFCSAIYRCTGIFRVSVFLYWRTCMLFPPPPLETQRQIGLKSTQVIYPNRDSDCYSVCPYGCHSLLLRLSQSLWRSFHGERRDREFTVLNPVQAEILVWCEPHYVIALSGLSQMGEHWKTDQTRCGACRWSTSFCSCLVVTGLALNKRSH